MITQTGNIWCQMLLNMSRESLMLTRTDWKYLVPNVVEYVKGVTHDYTY